MEKSARPKNPTDAQYHFRRPVVPGDQLRMECEGLQRRSNTIKVKGTATVDGNVVAEAEMLSIMVERPK